MTTLALGAMGATILLLLAVAVFFGRELLKKFGFIGRFMEVYGHAEVWRYPGSEEMGIKPGMYNLRITPHAFSRRKFSVLVMMKFKGNGLDPFAFISDSEGSAYLRTWLGRGAVEFHFVTGDEGLALRVELDLGAEVQDHEPDAVAKPHWWQPLGFFG